MNHLWKGDLPFVYTGEWLQSGATLSSPSSKNPASSDANTRVQEKRPRFDTGPIEEQQPTTNDATETFPSIIDSEEDIDFTKVKGWKVIH
jgi:hypothetical protein